VADADCETGAVSAYGNPDDLTPPPIRVFALASGSEDDPRRRLADCTYKCDLECPFSGEDLHCVGAYKWPKPSVFDIAVDVSVELFEKVGAQGSPLPGAKVEVCGAESADCVPMESEISDATGHARFTLAINAISGFRGFVRVTGDTPSGPMFPVHAMVYPIISDTWGTAYVAPKTLFDGLASSFAGGRVDGRAHILTVISDCTLHRAPGLTLELPPEAMDGATRFYFSGGQQATGVEGMAMIFNAMAGCYDLVARNADGVETHRMTIKAAPDVLTLVALEPSSAPPDLGNNCVPNFTYP